MVFAACTVIVTGVLIIFAFPRASASELQSASRAIENSKAKDAELERVNAFLAHKQQEVQRKVDQESEKRKKVKILKLINTCAKNIFLRIDPTRYIATSSNVEATQRK